MKQEIAERLIDGIDQAYIEEYFATQEKLLAGASAGRARWVRLLPIAATLAGVLLIGGVFLLPQLRKDKVPTPVPVETETAETETAETSESAYVPDQVTDPGVVEESDREPETVTEEDGIPEDPPEVETVVEPDEDIALETSSTSTESLPLLFSDYNDFLLFGSKGELDPDKYPYADILLQSYGQNRAARVDFKKMLNLVETGWRESIVIQDKDYILYSTAPSGGAYNGYDMDVQYIDHESEKKPLSDNATSIQQPSDIADQAGLFYYQTDDFELLIVKEDSAYRSLTFVHGKIHVTIKFNTNRLWTREAITSYCGTTVAALAFGNANEMNTAVAHISDVIAACLERN